jgi:hypothetical protein
VQSVGVSSWQGAPSIDEFEGCVSGVSSAPKFVVARLVAGTAQSATAAVASAVRMRVLLVIRFSFSFG